MTGNSAKLEKLYADWTGQRLGFPDVAYQKKLFVMRELFGVEMRSLGRELANLARNDRYSRELDSASLCDALIEGDGVSAAVSDVHSVGGCFGR